LRRVNAPAGGTSRISDECVVAGYIHPNFSTPSLISGGNCRETRDNRGSNYRIIAGKETDRATRRDFYSREIRPATTWPVLSNGTLSAFENDRVDFDPVESAT